MLGVPIAVILIVAGLINAALFGNGTENDALPINVHERFKCSDGRTVDRTELVVPTVNDSASADVLLRFVAVAHTNGNLLCRREDALGIFLKNRADDCDEATRVIDRVCKY